MKAAPMIVAALILCIAIQGSDQRRAGAFHKAGYGQLCSDSKYRIRDVATCQAAAAALGLDWGQSWWGPWDFPGCLHAKDNRNKVFFNLSPHATNDPSSNPKMANYAEICTGEDTMAESGCTINGITNSLVVTGGDNNQTLLSSSQIITSTGVCKFPNIPLLPQKTTGGKSVWSQNTLMFCGGSSDYVFGEHNANNWGSTNECFTLTPGHTEWKNNPQNWMKTPRAWFSLTRVNEGRVIAAGGHDGDGHVLNTLEMYADGKWEMMDIILPNATYGHCAIYYQKGWENGKKSYLMIIGGSNRPKYPVLNATGCDEQVVCPIRCFPPWWCPPCCFNPYTGYAIRINLGTGNIEHVNHWPLPALWAPACTLVGEDIFVSGGASHDVSDPETNGVYKYNIKTDQWSRVGNFISGRWGHIMGETNLGQMVIAGGYGGIHFSTFNNIESSDNKGVTWTVRKQALTTGGQYMAMAQVPKDTFTCKDDGSNSGSTCCPIAETIIGGVTKSEFWHMREEMKLTYFENLCQLEKKSLVLMKFCNFSDNSEKETCCTLIKTGMTDTQRLNIFAYNNGIRNECHKEACNTTCKTLRSKVHILQEEIVKKVNNNTSINMEGMADMTSLSHITTQEVSKSRLSSGLNVENLKKSLKGLIAGLGLVENLENSKGDIKKIAIAITSFVSSIGPFFGPEGEAASAIAGVIGLILNWGGGESPDDKLAKLIGELGIKIEQQGEKTRQQIHKEISDQTKKMQAGFSTLGIQMSNNTYQIGQEIKEQTSQIIAHLSQVEADIKELIKNAIIIFTTSNQQQTSMILDDIQKRNERQLQTLENLYTKADNNIMLFYEMMDELKGLKEKLRMIQIFLHAGEKKNTYRDVTILMEQINTFVGAKQLGATKSWMTRFCTKWTNAMLCIDLLSMYVSLASVRDHIFLNLAADIKGSINCDADVLSQQITKTLRFRQQRDGDFLKQMILNTRSNTAECFISCYIEIANHGAVPNGSLVPGLNGTVLQGTKYDLSDGPFICGYISAVSSVDCNYDNTMFCKNCFEKVKCSTGFYKISDGMCAPCGCNTTGTADREDICNENGQCFCDSRFEGDKCDDCKSNHTEHCIPGDCQKGFFNNGTFGCQPCKCYSDGSTTEICNKETGECICKKGYEDEKCDNCTIGYFKHEGLCLPCTGCNKALTVNEDDCNPNGSCKCKENAIGIKCDKCKPGFYEDDSSCRACDCGKGSTSNECDSNGKCTCQIAYEGPKCTLCSSNAYKNPNGDCELCNCYSAGTIGGKQDCDDSGTCFCALPYTNTHSNNKCRFMHGFSAVKILFGDNSGNSGYDVYLWNKKGDKCTTSIHDMDHKNEWFTYDGKNQCNDWMVTCNYIKMEIYSRCGVFTGGCFDTVTIKGVQVVFGDMVFEDTFTWTSHGWPDWSRITMTFYCTSGCEDGFTNQC